MLLGAHQESVCTCTFVNVRLSCLLEVEEAVCIPLLMLMSMVKQTWGSSNDWAS